MVLFDLGTAVQCMAKWRNERDSVVPQAGFSSFSHSSAMPKL